MYILTFVTSIGAFQGIIILLSILFRFRHRKNMPLALLLIVFSARLATIPTWNPDILTSHPWVYPLTAPLPFLFGPLLWWYIRELVSDDLNVPAHIYLHFLPYTFELLALSYTLLSMGGDEYINFIHSIFSGTPPLWLPVRNGVKVLLNLVYVVLCGRIAFGKKSGRISSTKRLWLRLMLIIPSLVLLSFSYVAVVPYVTKHLIQGIITPFFILSVTMSVLIYAISFLLIIAPEAYPSESKEESEQYERLCSDEECEYLAGLVEKRFSEGAYRNPGLMLSDFAAEFNVHPNRLSYAINHCFNSSFRNLLNGRRIDYFCSLIKEGVHKRQSILAIAFDAGFPSKSTFNRVFKEKTGIPPSEFLKQMDAV
jgi:AraC-like DNA-binding protein